MSGAAWLYCALNHRSQSSNLIFWLNFRWDKKPILLWQFLIHLFLKGLLGWGQLLRVWRFDQRNYGRSTSHGRGKRNVLQNIDTNYCSYLFCEFTFDDHFTFIKGCSSNKKRTISVNTSSKWWVSLLHNEHQLNWLLQVHPGSKYRVCSGTQSIFLFFLRRSQQY